MLVHVLIFCFYLIYGTIIAMLNFTSVVKILCNFGILQKVKRHKDEDKRRGTVYQMPHN